MNGRRWTTLVLVAVVIGGTALTWAPKAASAASGTPTTVTPEVPKDTTTTTRPLGSPLKAGATVPPKSVTAMDMYNSFYGIGTAHLPATTFGMGRYYLVSTMSEGVTWHVIRALPKSLTPAQPLLLQMAFVSQKEGYLALLGSTHVDFTNNGGRTWLKVKVPGRPAAMSLSGTSVWFTTQQCPASATVNFGCPTVLAVVPFGARTATTVTPIPLEGPAASDPPPSGNTQTTLLSHVGTVGWAVEDGGALSTLLVTVDDGVSWQRANNPCTKLFPVGIARDGTTAWALYCSLDGGMNQGTNELWTSADTGRTWTLVAMANEEGAVVGSIPSEMMGDLTASANGQILWLLGDVGGISVSTNGGSTWTQVDLSSGGYQGTIATAGSIEGWLPIPGVGLFQTVNGTTWNRVTGNGYVGSSSPSLENVTFFNSNDGDGLFFSNRGNQCRTLVGTTSNGGANFSDLHVAASGNCNDQDVTQLAFDDHDDGFLYGPGLMVSHNGGLTWTAMNEPGNVLSVEALGLSIWMVEASCPVASGPQTACPLTLQESTDGGRTWQSTDFPAHSSFNHDFGGMTRVSTTSAYVLSDPNSDGNGLPDYADLWFTSDSGGSWSKVLVPCGMDAMTDQLSVAPDGVLFVVCASEPSAGSQLKSVVRSADGGAEWQVESDCIVTSISPQPACASSAIGFGYLGSIEATSADTVYLVGARSSLLVTHDGGQTWSAVMPLIGGTDDGTIRVIFFNANDGLVFGHDGNNDEAATIWHTSDGGGQWYPLVPQTGES